MNANYYVTTSFGAKFHGTYYRIIIIVPCKRFWVMHATGQRIRRLHWSHRKKTIIKKRKWSAKQKLLPFYRLNRNVHLSLPWRSADYYASVHRQVWRGTFCRFFFFSTRHLKGPSATKLCYEVSVIWEAGSEILGAVPLKIWAPKHESSDPILDNLPTCEWN